MRNSFVFYLQSCVVFRWAGWGVWESRAAGVERGPDGAAPRLSGTLVRVVDARAGTLPDRLHVSNGEIVSLFIYHPHWCSAVICDYYNSLVAYLHAIEGAFQKASQWWTRHLINQRIFAFEGQCSKILIVIYFGAKTLLSKFNFETLYLRLGLM